MDQEVSTPIRSGIKLFLVDNGISFSFGVILGTIFLLAGYSVNQITNSKAADLIGLIISMYAAFLLYKNYSKERKALITLIVTAIVATVADMILQKFSHQSLHATTKILALAADVVAYGIGWYVAAITNVKIFLLSKKWTTAFFVIGIIGTVIGLLSQL